MINTLIVIGIFIVFYFIAVRPLRMYVKRKGVSSEKIEERKNWVHDSADPLYQDTFHRQASKEW